MAVTAADSIQGTYSPSKSYRSLLSILMINAALIALWSSGLAPGLSAEDGILEMLQLLLAAGAFSVFMFAALQDDGPIGSAGTATAAIAAIAIVREIDVRKMVVPDWMMIWANSPFRDTTVAILLVLVLGYVWLRRDHFRGWLELLLRRAAWPFWLGGMLLASSLVFDGGKIISGEAGVLVEEFIEFNGFMLLLVAGWRHCQLLTSERQREL